MQSMYFAANKQTHEFICNSGIYGSKMPDEEDIKKAISEQHNIDIDLITLWCIGDEQSVYKNNGESPENNVIIMNRVLASDEFELLWGNSGTIEDISFYLEDNKQLLEFSVDKTEVIMDGIDFINMTCKVLNPDGEVDENYNKTLKVPVGVPYGRGLVFIKGTFENGVLTRKFYPMALGTYYYPVDKNKYNGFKIKNQVIVESEFGV